MNQTKRTVIGITAVLAAGALIGGCGSSKTTETSAAPSQGAAATAAPTKAPSKIKLEVMKVGWGNKMPEASADFVKAELDKKFNLDLVLTLPANGDDLKNTLNTRIAAADYPDVMELSDRNQLQQYAEKGLLLDLTPYLDKLGDVKKFLGDDSFKKGTINGKIYSFSKAPNLAADVFYIRKDWLTKLNLKMPGTLDELYDTAKAFVEKDPDGNGKKDTIGITGNGVYSLAPIFGGYGVPGPKNFFLKDGQLVNSLYDPGMKDAIVAIQKLINGGVVDPEFFTNKNQTAQEKAFKGTAGIIYTSWSNIMKDEFQKQIKSANPNAEWVQVPALKGPGGDFVGTEDIGSTSGLVAIPKTIEKDKEKLQRIFDLLNYVSTTEGGRLVQYGLNGKHFNVTGDKVVPTDLMATEAAYIWVYQFTGRPEQEYLSTKFAKQAQDIAGNAAAPRIKVLNGFIDLPTGYNKADAERFIDEEFVKFLFGKTPISEYDSFLKKLEDTFKYKLLLDQANKQIKELGIAK